MHKYILVFFCFSIMFCYSATQEERLNSLRYICLYIPSDDLTINEVLPTPADIKERYKINDIQLINDLKALSMKYSVAETNAENRLCRISSIGWMADYGTTNELQYLRSIMYNPKDYAQEAALEASLYILKLNPALISLANEVVTNKAIFSLSKRSRVYSQLQYMCYRGGNVTNELYVSDTNAQARIAAFFLERATVEEDFPLYVDQVACELNPSYRHSQQRRDNLARLRKPGLTGLPAQIYDAAQRDALPKEAK